MDVKDFAKAIDSDFYTGVPDSQLKALCNYLMTTYSTDPKHHIVAANEGNAVGLAAGYYLATGKIPVVYMQNSGQGNAINPIASLLNDEVYGIPALFVIGWRGEPGVHDEPQHIFQGQITLSLLELLDIGSYVIDSETTQKDIEGAMDAFRSLFAQGKSAAFVVRKGALTFDQTPDYSNGNSLQRERAIEIVSQYAGNAPIVSTTGKPSRELFEVRERNNQEHSYDFLTVGSMGHASSIALEIAAQKPKVKVWCIDGDGAMLMHMGAMAVIGACGQDNLVHVVLDNGSHETVGGVPTVARDIDLCGVAVACGYRGATRASTEEELKSVLEDASKATDGPNMIVVDCALGSRSDLGRPTISPVESKKAFMKYLSL